MGRVVADRLSVPHGDTDDYFWLPTDPPYTDTRPVDERLSLMESVFLPRSSWVISGSLMGWGEPIMEKVDGIVFLTLDPQRRLARLKAREDLRYGEAINAGGSLEESHREFIDWAAGYDDPNFDGRSRKSHENWLASFASPVLRLEANVSVSELSDEVSDWLGSDVFNTH